jgi:hypothetical protein
MILLFRQLDSAPLLAFVLCGDATNSAGIFPFFFGGFIVTKSEFTVSGFKNTSEDRELIKANVTCEGVSLNLGFVFSRIYGIVSSCLPYHKSSLVLLWFRIWGIFGSF